MTRRRPKINPSVALNLSTPKLGELSRLFKKIQEQPQPLHRGVHGPCWIWTGYRDGKGYGQITIRGKARWVHRVMYALFKRSITAGAEIDHRCLCPSCCNPAHLRMTSRSRNSSMGGKQGAMARTAATVPAVTNFDPDNW